MINGRCEHGQRIGGRIRSTLKYAFVCACMILGGCGQTSDSTVSESHTTTATAHHLHVEITADMVTLEARNVTIRRVLEEIALLGDLELVSEEPLDTPISIELQRVYLPTALSRILQHHNFALQYSEQPSSAGDEQTEIRASRLWVFADDSETDRTPSGVVPDNEALHMDASHGDGERRWRAMRNLAMSGSDDAAAALSLALIDTDADVRVDAVAALSKLGSAKAVSMLGTALSDTDPYVREAAADALGGVGDETALQSLEHALGDPQKEVREAVIKAFAEIGGDASALALSTALADPDVSLREETVDALGEIGGATAVLLLQQALADEQNSVRAAAAEWLAERSQHE